MSRVPQQAGEANRFSRPCFPTFTVIGVAALLVVISLTWWRNHRSETTVPQTAPVAESETTATSAEEVVNPSTVTTPAVPLARTRISASQGRPGSDQASPGAGYLGADQLIGQLSQLQIAGGKLTAEQARQIQQSLQQLVAQGAAALPAIREFLDKNLDLPFGDNGSMLAGASSLRAGLIDGLRQIGGPDAIALSRQVLQNTADPTEISMLARNLEEAAPGQYRQEALDAARQALAQAAAGNLNLSDVGPLFKVIESYGDSNVAADLENAGTKWGTYATMALAGLPSGDGIPSLVKIAQDPGSLDSGQSKLALQMLAQLSGQYPDAGSALVEMAKQNQIPDAVWRRIVDGLAGDQYQIGAPPTVSGQNSLPISGLKTYHLEGGNQNFYSLPVTMNGPAPDLSQRIAIIDQLLNAAAGNPAAVQALNDARSSLSSGK
jgi:hypothetical protein